MLEDITQFLNDALEKLYITIPVILTFISSFGGTLIYKFGKLISDAKNFANTTNSVVQSNKKASKQLKQIRKQQALFQKQVCNTLKLISKACLPHKRAEVIDSINKVEELIESDDVIDADFVEKVIEEVSNQKTHKIKVKKA